LFPIWFKFINFKFDLFIVTQSQTHHTQLDKNEIIQDVHSFSQRFIEILMKKYWKFESDLLTEELSNAIEKAIFSNGLYHRIISNYQKKYSSHDLRFLQKCEKLKNLTLEDFEVNLKFRLEKQLSPYHKVIDLLKQLNYPSSSSEKINLISKGISEISETVVEYYKDSNEYEKSDLILGAEDMLPIFIYCIIKTQCSSIYSILMFLVDFIDEDNIKGSEGYCLATLETSVNEVLNFEVKERKYSLPPSRPPPSPFSILSKDDFSDIGPSLDEDFSGNF
jgi:hypothetical protein